MTPRNLLVAGATALALALIPHPVQGEEGGVELRGAWSAQAGLYLAAEALDPAVADSAAAFGLKISGLERAEGPGWGAVLAADLDASAASAGATGASPTAAVHEAYARLDLGDWGQVFLGKRRFGLGLGTVFAPGDAINPRDGFWDQVEGFRGLGLTASLGADLSVKAALSLERNLAAYTAGLAAKKAAAAGASNASVLAAAYQAALDEAGAAGPADPRLLSCGVAAEALLGSLQVAAAGVYAPGATLRPSLGASLDLGGLILQAEGALELEGGTTWSATGGLHYDLSAGGTSLHLALDYDYNGATGLLLHRHYLLPAASVAVEGAFGAWARALIEVEAPSALLSVGLTLYPAEGFDLEASALFCLGSSSGEFSSLASSAASALASPSTGSLGASLGLIGRIHL